MNIQRLRNFNNIIAIMFILFFLSSCQKERKIKSIATAMEIDEGRKDYYFSDDADIIIGGKKYSLRSKIDYDNQGNFAKLLVYHPEGVLVYGRSHMNEDPKHFASFGYPRINKLSYKENLLNDGFGETLKVEEIGDDYLKYKSNDNKKVKLYILE